MGRVFLSASFLELCTHFVSGSRLLWKPAMTALGQLAILIPLTKLQLFCDIA